MNNQTLTTIERLSRLINESVNVEVTAMLIELMRQAIAEDRHHLDLDSKSPTPPPLKQDWTLILSRYPVQPRTEIKQGCSVCGIGANGESMGYVCSRHDCPTRITCS